MKLTIQEVYALNQAQGAYDKQKKRVFALSLLLVHNNKALQAEIDKFEEARKKLEGDEDIVAYQKERQEIVNKFLIPKAGGGYETDNQNGQMVYKLKEGTDSALLDAELKVFDGGKEAVVKKIEANNKEINEQVNVPIEVKVKSITNVEHVKSLSLESLVILAPVIKVKLTEDVLGDKGDSLTTADIKRLMTYCTFE